ncbi:MAG: hypothetical protein HY322_10495 [Betaproteobacteria bacterium]|nr:hypothetical protein [Betaproteobacteria bacterium]
MTPNSLGSTRPLRRQASSQQLVTRHNPVMFYGIAAAALLETTGAACGAALLAVLGADAQSRSWIEQVWLPAKRAHAERTRAYVEAMWPEFEWAAACDQFSADHRRLTRTAGTGAGIAKVALACSMAAAQAAVFYRGLGAAADDPELRHLLQDMAADEAAHFENFRCCYERHRQREHLGMLASYRTIVSCASRARDVDVQLVFSRLNGSHWYGSVPFQELTYADFVARLACVVRRNLPLGLAQRLLFKPWLTARDLPAVPAASSPRPVSARGMVAPRLAAGAQSR